MSVRRILSEVLSEKQIRESRQPVFRGSTADYDDKHENIRDDIMMNDQHAAIWFYSDSSYTKLRFG